MENQTRFGLNNALENWRTELAAQPNLSADDRRELETHLRDTFGELKSRGLSEEESFWLARRRVGQPQQLAEEFIKADPMPVWRERIFWLVLSLLAIRLWNVIAGSLTEPFFTLSALHSLKLGGWLPQWVSFYLPAWVDNLSSSSIYIFLFETTTVLLPLTIVFLLGRGKNQKLQAILDFIFKSRTRFIVYLIALVVFDYVASVSIWNALMAKAQFHTNISFLFLMNHAFGLFCLIILAVWLMPTQNRLTPKRIFKFMENQTRFDLNAALENWQAELATQPGLSMDDRRELETHLCDTFAELKLRGLSEEESFWLARCRVGQPQQLADEFVKADPMTVWHERMFWLVLSLLIIRLWKLIASSLTTYFDVSVSSRLKLQLHSWLPQWVSFYLPAWVNNLESFSIIIFLSETINVLLLLTIVFLLVRGENQKLQAIMDFIFKSRTRFSIYLIALVALDYVAGSSIWNALMAKFQFHLNFFDLFVSHAFELFCLIALAVWLMPVQNLTARRRA